MNELYHHGVKGMHWGVRKKQQNTINKVKTSAASAIKAYADDKVKTSKAIAKNKSNVNITASTIGRVAVNRLSVNGMHFLVDALPMSQVGKSMARNFLVGYGTFNELDALSTGAMSLYYKNKK